MSVLIRRKNRANNEMLIVDQRSEPNLAWSETVFNVIGQCQPGRLGVVITSRHPHFRNKQFNLIENSFRVVKGNTRRPDRFEPIFKFPPSIKQNDAKIEVECLGTGC
jgi:hypothetical protein